MSADVRRFFQLINADEVLGTHRGLFQMAVDMRPLTREELVRSLPRELERLARSLLGRLRTERPAARRATFIIPSINGFSVVIRGLWRLGMLVGHYPLLLFKGLTFKEAA